MRKYTLRSKIPLIGPFVQSDKDTRLKARQEFKEDYMGKDFVVSGLGEVKAVRLKTSNPIIGVSSIIVKKGNREFVVDVRNIVAVRETKKLKRVM